MNLLAEMSTLFSPIKKELSLPCTQRYNASPNKTIQLCVYGTYSGQFVESLIPDISTLSIYPNEDIAEFYYSILAIQNNI